MDIVCLLASLWQHELSWGSAITPVAFILFGSVTLMNQIKFKNAKRCQKLNAWIMNEIRSGLEVPFTNSIHTGYLNGWDNKKLFILAKKFRKSIHSVFFLCNGTLHPMHCTQKYNIKINDDVTLGEFA